MGCILLMFPTYVTGYSLAQIVKSKLLLTIPNPFLQSQTRHNSWTIAQQLFLDDVCKEGKGYQYGTVELNPIQARGVFRDPQRFLSITLRAFKIIL